MPKSIYFTDDRYEQIVEAARKCGYRVSRGRGSQLAQFVVMASNTACSGRLVRPAKEDDPNSKKATAKVVGSPRRR